MPHKDIEKRKEYIREYRRKKYHENREENSRKTQERKKKYVDACRKYIRHYKETHPCVDCGESDWVTLDFDHVRGEKKFVISAVGRKVFSLEKVKAEIEKCEIRCANCHRRKTFAERHDWI